MKNLSWEKKVLPGLLLLQVLTFPVLAQGYSKSFRVPSGSGELEVVNKMGSVSVNVAEGNTITVTAKQTEAPINATQSSQGKVKVTVTGNATVDLVINVPTSTALDLTCIKGELTIRNMSGPIRARTTEGDIQLSGIRSSKVEAGSSSGNVSFSGDVLPTGSYTLKSFSGRVSAILPASSDFKLQASSNNGGIDVGSYGLSFDKQSDKQVEGKSGAGHATVTLWTQEGSVQLRRR